ncbi:MAG: hypothetical protein QNJ32_15470 [Xenococcaceae cyanobacterium MO_167.B27]|nr:hypothetical protein [Xenococcaceae cyanobacterium MO_167.B27]
MELVQPNFIVRISLSLDGFISHPCPTKSFLSRLLAGLRIYSPDTSLLDNRLLQLKKCLSLIQLELIIQWLELLLYKYFVFFLYISPTVKTVSRLFLPDLKDRGFPSTYTLSFDPHPLGDEDFSIAFIKE